MTKRLLLFVHYDRDGRVDEHILYLLNALKPFRDKTVFLANSPLMQEDERCLAPVADRVIRRENKGFDFGAWGEALQEYGEELERDFDSLLLVNSSCFGPLFPLKPMFEEMEKTGCDFWGVTEHSRAAGVPAHLQSYFMEVRKNVFTSRAFREFFRTVGKQCTDYRSAVRYGEIGFSQAMTRAGFRYRSFVSMHDAREARNAGILEPFSFTAAPFLIREHRLPFLKVKAFSQVPKSPVFRGSEIFRALRETGSDYPVRFITDFLRRTAPLSWQKNLPDTLLSAERTAAPVPAPQLKTGVFFHCFYPESAEKTLACLKNIPMDFDLLVTSPFAGAESAVRKIAASIPRIRNLLFRLTPNRGRDIAPWLAGFPAERHLAYDAVLKLHVKKSPQMPEAFVEAWQNDLLDNLAGSPALVSAILRAFAEEPRLGMVFPPYPPVVTLQCPSAYAGHPDDAAAGRAILKRLRLNPPSETGMPVFGVGTMFWYRPAALKALLLENWMPEDFPPEPLPWRGTAAHAMERILPCIAQAQGFYFRQSIHADRLAEAFRTYENRVIYFKPQLKQAFRTLCESLKTSIRYRFFRR